MATEHSLYIKIKEGQEILVGNNKLSLIVGNNHPLTSHDRVVVRFTASPGLDVRPEKINISPLHANSTKLVPVTLYASQVGKYEIKVQVSAFPTPLEGFLTTTLQFDVSPLPDPSPSMKRASIFDEIVTSPVTMNNRPPNTEGEPPSIHSSTPPSIESRSIFDTAIIRELLIVALNENDLIDLCQDYFPKVYVEFSEGMKNSTRRRLLIEHCQHHNLLLQLVQYIRTINPAKHREYFARLVKPILDKFESGIETDHIQAAQTLKQLDELEAIQLLEAQLLGVQKPDVGYRLTIAIGRIGGPNAKEVLDRIQRQLNSRNTNPYILLGIKDARKIIGF